MDNDTQSNKATVVQFLKRPKTAAPTPSLNPMEANGKVKIDVACEHLPTLNAQCWAAIGKCNEPPVIFRFAGGWARVVTDEQGFPKPQTVTPEILRHELSNWADWHKNEIAVAKPPLDVMKDVLATREPSLPILRRMVSVPVFAPDGSLRLQPGYNAASGVLYAPAPNFTALPVPAEITAEQCQAARDFILNELIVDFPFASAADRDNAVGLLLLPFARDLIDGPTPNHLVEASVAASGKSKLVDALLWAALGGEVPILTEQHEDDAWRKAITSHLLAGKQAAKIDNVNRPVNSGALAAAWTGATWDDRILGGNTLASVPIRTIWTMTGNNVTLSSELIRRCVRIRLVPTTDRPEEREGFKHPDLLGWCRENQAKLAQAAHVMIRWWLQNGSPRPEKLKPMGSYEHYTRVIGGILHSVGLLNFLTNYRDFQGAADTQRAIRSAFCHDWYEWALKQPSFGAHTPSFKVSELMPLAEALDDFPLSGNTPKAHQVSLGRWLKSNAEAYVDYEGENESGAKLSRTYRIVPAGIRDASMRWKVELIE